MQFLQKLRNNKGSSLVVVLVAFAVLVIMGLTLISVASYGHKTTFHYHKKQQAQYTARFVMDIMTKSLADPNISAKLITSVKAGNKVVGSGNLTTENLGTYQVTVDPPVVPTGGTKPMMKVTVLADFQGVPYSLSAYYKEGKGDRMNPMDFLFFINGGSIADQSGSKVENITFDGKVYIDGVFTTENVLFKQKTLSFTSAVFGAGTLLEGDFAYMGSVTPTPVSHTGIYKGWVYTPNGRDPAGNVMPDIGYNPNVRKYQKIWSSIQYDVDLTNYKVTFGKGKFNGGKGLTIERFAIVYPDDTSVSIFPTFPATFPPYNDGNGNKITYLGAGEFELDFDGVKDKVKTAVNHAGGVYTAANGDQLKFDNLANLAENKPGVFIPHTPSTSQMIRGTIVAGDYNISGASSTGPVVFDTTAGDIHLYAQSNFDFRDDATIIGANNVYIHIGGNSLTVASNKSIGQNGKTEHQLFIDGNQATVTLKDGVVFKGCIYLLGGSNFIDSGATSGNKITGSVTAKNIKLFSGNTYAYVDYLKDPDCDATIVNPLKGASEIIFRTPPFNSSTEKDWKLVKYDN